LRFFCRIFEKLRFAIARCTGEESFGGAHFGKKVRFF
jgi:hypothetical protein